MYMGSTEEAGGSCKKITPGRAENLVPDFALISTHRLFTVTFETVEPISLTT